MKTCGGDDKMMKTEVSKAKTGLFCKALVVMKVTEVYDCMPCKHAGDRLISPEYYPEFRRSTHGVLNSISIIRAVL